MTKSDYMAAIEIKPFSRVMKSQYAFGSDIEFLYTKAAVSSPMSFCVQLGSDHGWEDGGYNEAQLREMGMDEADIQALLINHKKANR